MYASRFRKAGSSVLSPPNVILNHRTFGKSWKEVEVEVEEVEYCQSATHLVVWRVLRWRWWCE